MNIPYTVEERPDTGLTNGKLGIWLFLASEVMLFGALFSTYIILRVGAPEWPHGELNIWLGAINTVILISSSVTMVMAWASLKMNDWGKHRIYLISTFVLAGLFLIYPGVVSDLIALTLLLWPGPRFVAEVAVRGEPRGSLIEGEFRRTR